MGVDYCAMTVIGIRVHAEKMKKTKLSEPENDCKCIPKVDPMDYPDAKFCSKCGMHLRYQHEYSEPKFEGLHKYGGMKDNNILGWPARYGTDAEYYFIGIYATGLVDHQEKSELPEITPEIRAKFQADMESIGLWDEKEFGLWTILYCSY